MENIISTLNQINSYMIYPYILLLLIILIVAFVLIYKLVKLSKEANIMLNSINHIQNGINDASIKADISSNAIGGYFNSFFRIMSVVQVIKYFINKENRRRDKEFKKYQKNKEKLSKVIG